MKEIELSYLQNGTANAAYLAAHFCPALVCPQKATVRISSIFFESPHQVHIKNVVKSSKHFFGYFNTLETHSVFFRIEEQLIVMWLTKNSKSKDFIL